MNKHCVFMLLSLLLLQITTFCQETFIEANSITVTCNKTTHLIFPYAIKSIDRGSEDVLAQKAPDADNVLQLKAAKAEFAETNVTVITADNKLYPFKVNYSLYPQHLTISFAENINGTTTAHANVASLGLDVNSQNADIALMQQTIKQVATEKKNRYDLYAHEGLIHLLLKGIYIKNDVFYFQFLIKNTSNISFDVQNIAFIIKNSRRAKRTAVQEQVIQPLVNSAMDSSIRSHSSQVWIIALRKFTMKKGRYLSIQVLEANGGRNLSLKVYNRHLLAAKVL